MNPIIPMVAITGDPSTARIQQFMESLHSGGICQALLYPRSGCEVEYMSRRWFEVVGDFLAAARDHGMHIWLYDDFNWPSGHCGGKVVAVPEYRLKAIRIRGEEKGRIHTSAASDDYFQNGRFPDVMSEKAVDYFIACTHEAYYQRFPSYFGSTIQGIFTDEPAISYACGEDDLPYYDGLKEDYGLLYGRSFDEDLAADWPDFQYSVMNLLSDRFKNCYAKKLSDWCRSHGIVMTGHMLSDSSPGGAVKRGGKLLDNLTEYMLPGVDEIHTDLKEDLALFGVAEYVRGQKKKTGCDLGAMAELFALGPCDMSYAKRNCMLHFAACFKIDHYFVALAPLDVRGSYKIKDFFNCFTPIQPDFEGMNLLCRDAEDAAVWAQKDFLPDIYIRYPYRAYCKDVLTRQSDRQVVLLLDTLSRHQIQWKYLQEDDPVPEDKDIPVIHFGEHLRYLNEDGTAFDLEKFCAGFTKDELILLEDGTLPEGLFVRRFEDGTALALNLNDYPLSLSCCGSLFHMEGYDVHSFRIGSEIADFSAEAATFDRTMQVKYGNDNLIRAMFINDQTTAEIFCSQRVEISLIVRKGVEAMLDGNPVIASREAELPDGIKELYSQSQPVMLEPGIHWLKAGDDLKYLPSVMLKGPFSAESVSGPVCRVNLSPRTSNYRAGERICDFGKICFSANIQVPEHASSLLLRGTTLYTKLFLDDSFIGECCRTPYVYEIPARFSGRTCRLTVEQYSSIAPIYGDVDYHDKQTTVVSWRNTPVPGKTEFGLDDLAWIIP